MFEAIVRQADVLTVSIENVEHVILEAKRYEAGRVLAASLASASPNKMAITNMIDEYLALQGVEELEDVQADGVEVFTGVDVAKLTEKVLTPGARLQVYPLSINDKLRGGLLPGHHVVIIATPDVGKTALAITMAAGFAYQGAPGLYIGNEDPASDIIMRLVCNLASMTQDEVEADPHRAQKRAEANGLGLITVVSCSPGSSKMVEQFVKKYKPRWVVMDQMKNLAAGKAESKTIQYEQNATDMRNIGKKHGVSMISLAQAGDSAQFKAVLDMGDCYNSNTGIPGACDVLIGIGATREHLLTDDRVISISKNKLGGEHHNFPVRLNRYLSKFTKI